jgi:hypothetical protein
MPIAALKSQKEKKTKENKIYLHGESNLVTSVGTRHDSHPRVKGGGLILGMGRLQD